MKNFIVLIVFLFDLLLCSGQTINLNPDPNGEPWPVSTEEITVTSGNCQNPLVFQPTPASLNKPLPVAVHNEESIWWPFIINQNPYNSCIQVAEIFYTFTYEINRKRNLNAGDEPEDNFKSNRYNQHYTYNQTATGANGNSGWHSGFCIVRDNGCPNYEEFYDPEIFSRRGDTVYTYWMTGTNKYISGMDNRISEIYKFPFGINTTDLNHLKHWIADHGRGESTGGLAVIGVYMDGSSLIPITQPGQYVDNRILSLGYAGAHALTIVGFDDNVPISATESGAFKIANSWGVGTWGDLGFAWLPYSSLVSNGNGLVLNYAYTCDVFPTEDNPINEPEISIAANIEHNNRSKLLYYVGHDEITEIVPGSMEKFETFSDKGNENQMRGVFYPGPIDMAFNFSHFYTDNFNNPFQKVFFKIHQNTAPEQGQLNSLTLIDHRWNEVFELPFQITNNTINNGTNLFHLDYYLLPHHDHYISSNTLLESNRVSRFTNTVTNGANLIVGDNVIIDMYDSEIHIKPGSTLQLNSNSKIIAKRGQCKIIVEGDILIYPDVQFIAEGDASLEVFLNDTSSRINIKNATFKQCKVYSYAASLLVSNSSFENCTSFCTYAGDLNFHYNSFTNTGLYLENNSKNQEIEVNITHCKFTNTSPDITAIKLTNYGKYAIIEDTIQGYTNGIYLFNSGSGPAGFQKIENNIISSSINGLLAYNSIGSVYKNNIFGNHYGIKFMDNSNFALYGDSEAQSFAQTQQIRDNTGCEVYASKHSFPWYFHYNVIIDEDNIGNPVDPLLYFAYVEGGRVSQKDIRYNCWGNNFNASVDLYPHTYFVYEPTWCPGISAQYTDVAEQLYIDGRTQFEAGQYNEAKAIFLLLIEQFPKTVYAEAAMKELVALEKFASDDYTTLKTYFQTNDSIQADSTLQVLASALANKCDVKLENWAQAISWYENQIINPASLEDSVFAIIDLGYVYFLMENQGLRSAYTGALIEFKPESKEQYFEHRDYLLSLLPGKTGNTDSQQALTQLTHGKLLQNVPNPFSVHTQIWYTTDIPARITISITDITGKEVGQINQGQKAEGTHQAGFNNAKLSPGIYFYSLVMDGVVSDTRKMSIIR